MKSVKVILLAMVLMSASSSETYREDFVKITASYKNKKSLSFSVLYKSFDTSLTIPDTTLIGKYWMKGSKFCVQIANTESIRNDKYYLSVDHFNKVMFLSYAKSASADFIPVKSIDSLLNKRLIDVRLEDLREGRERRYTVNYTRPVADYKSMMMEFDLKTYLVKRIILKLEAPDNEYDQKDWNYIDEPYVEFDYINYNFSELSDQIFSIDKFITVNNETDAVAKAKYKDYTFINSIAASQQIR